MYQSRALNPASLLGQVLGIVAVGFLVSALAAYFFTGLSSGLGFIAMLVGFGLLFAIQATGRNPGLSLMLFYAFAFAEGIGITPIIDHYTRLSGNGVVIDAATATGMGMLILASIAFMFSFDWRRLSGVAFGLLIALVLVGLVNVFVHFLHPSVYAWGTLAVFSLLTLIDFSRVRASSPYSSPVLYAVSIYLDALNIFLAFLQIFGGRDRR
jgi:FtsH-binding integral membrane protein